MNGYVGSWTFVAEYCAYIIIATIGVMQLIATRWGLKGIAFFDNKKWGYIFGIVAISGAFIWFFGFTDLNLKNPTFDTPPQLLWLAVSVTCAILLTFGISSIINKDINKADQDESSAAFGIDQLKRKTYWELIVRRSNRGEPR